ncbi:hypothetical protein AVEN_63984-1 [Araneus ventricosus]|uniref:Uncharacterized protein n=1 Tax=Araneus ventricosus TaxID=182803 RepID=A0A4Y2NGF7_ARAVE|nr:hypothetical protein AVEN_63984-1 [Araneus ventricosus]
MTCQIQIACVYRALDSPHTRRIFSEIEIYYLLWDCGQMARTTPQLAPLSPNFSTTPALPVTRRYIRLGRLGGECTMCATPAGRRLKEGVPAA